MQVHVAYADVEKAFETMNLRTGGKEGPPLWNNSVREAFEPVVLRWDIPEMGVKHRTKVVEE